MSRGTNQKFKFTYLMQIMLAKTDDEHSLTMSQIMEELEKCDVKAERKSIYADFQDMTDMCGVFIDRFGKDITFRPVDNEHSELHVDVNVSPQFFGWIFSLGKDVKVVGPEEVVEELRAKAEEFLENLNNESFSA